MMFGQQILKTTQLATASHESHKGISKQMAIRPTKDYIQSQCFRQWAGKADLAGDGTDPDVCSNCTFGKSIASATALCILKT